MAAIKPNKSTKIVINIGSVSSIRNAKNLIQKRKKFYSDANNLLQAFSDEIEKKSLRPMLRKLRKEQPPKRKYPDDYPIEYKSERQRRKVFAILKGKPYKRTRGLKNGWYYKIRKGRGKISITVGNEKPYSRFVVGKFGLGNSARQKRRYVQMQQKFHRITGWTPAYFTIQKYLSKAKSTGTTFIQKWINEGKL